MKKKPAARPPGRPKKYPPTKGIKVLAGWPSHSPDLNPIEEGRAKPSCGEPAPHDAAGAG